MTDLPPDPYKALNLTRTATQAEIKSAYRKAALRCHPDKAKDKDTAADEFNKIHQAYEILVDDERRRNYEDQVRLTELRREVYEKRGATATQYATSARGPSSHDRTTSFDVRNSPISSAQFSPRPSARFEERDRRTRERSYEDEYQPRAETTYFDRGQDESRTTSRKWDGYEARRAMPTRSLSKDDVRAAPRDENKPVTRGADKVSPKTKAHAQSKKQRDRDTRQARSSKYAASVDGDSEDSGEDAYRAQRRARDAEIEHERYEAQRRREAPRRSDDEQDDRSRKLSKQEFELKNYVIRSRAEGTASQKTSPQMYQSETFDAEPRRPARESRPNAFVRTPSKTTEKVSNRSKESVKETTRRTDRRSPEVESSQRSPSFQTQRSEPPKLPTESRRRAVDESEDDFRRPIPGIQRSATMPIRPGVGEHTTSSRSTHRRGDTTPVVSSGLRNTVPENDSGYNTSSPSEDTVTGMDETKEARTYRYSDVDSGPEKSYTNGKPTILREPASRGHTRRASSPPRRKTSGTKLSRDAERERDASREKGPPPSRSASYKFPVEESRPEPSRSRRPSLSRESSRETITRRPPPLSRGATMPTVKTNPTRDRDTLFGEVPRSESPSELRSPDVPSARRSSHDAGAPSKRSREDKYLPTAAPARRNSEQVDPRSRARDMDEGYSRRERDSRRPTYAQ